MKKNILRTIIDIIMVVLLLLMFSPRAICEDFHEIGGLVVFSLFLLHIALSWKWVVIVTQKLFGRQIPWRTRLLYILDGMILISVTTMIVTGILISESILKNISAQGTIWKSLHYFAAALSLLLVGAHIGLHWFFFKKMFSKIIRLPKVVSTVLSIVLLVAVMGFGGYNFINSDLADWLARPFQTNSSPSGARGMAEAGQDRQMPSNEGFFSGDTSSDSAVDSDSLIHPLDEETTETKPDASTELQPDLSGGEQPNTGYGDQQGMAGGNKQRGVEGEAQPEYNGENIPDMSLPNIDQNSAMGTQPGNQVSWTQILKDITTYGSIVLGVAGFVRLIEWLFNLKKKPQDPSPNNLGRLGPLDQTKLMF